MNHPEGWDDFSERPDPISSAAEWRQAYELALREGNHIDRINVVTEQIRRHGKIRPVPESLQLDEVVGRGSIHLERTGDDAIWMSLAGHTFWLFADGHRLEMRCEDLEALKAAVDPVSSKKVQKP